MKKRYLLLVTLLMGCNQEQAASVVDAAGKWYNASYRDNVIKNWQNKVSDAERCADFKVRFKAAGERHESAANGAFVNDMNKVWEEAKAANCKYSP